MPYTDNSELLQADYSDAEIIAWAQSEKERLGICFHSFELTWSLAAGGSAYALELYSESLSIADQTTKGFGPISQPDPIHTSPYRFGTGLVLLTVPFTEMDIVSRFEQLKQLGSALYFRLRKKMPELHRRFPSPILA